MVSDKTEDETIVWRSGIGLPSFGVQKGYKQGVRILRRGETTPSSTSAAFAVPRPSATAADSPLDFSIVSDNVTAKNR